MDLIAALVGLYIGAPLGAIFLLAALVMWRRARTDLAMGWAVAGVLVLVVAGLALAALANTNLVY